MAEKVAVFVLVIYLIIPYIMNVSSVIEQTYDLTVEATMKEAEDLTDEIDESSDSEGNILDQAISKIKGGVSGLLEKGEALLNNFIEAIAVMMVTSCLIPVVVLLFAFWIIRILFGIQINAPKDLPKRISSKMPGGKKRSVELQKKGENV